MINSRWLDVSKLLSQSSILGLLIFNIYMYCSNFSLHWVLQYAVNVNILSVIAIISIVTCHYWPSEHFEQIVLMLGRWYHSIWRLQLLVTAFLPSRCMQRCCFAWFATYTYFLMRLYHAYMLSEPTFHFFWTCIVTSIVQSHRTLQCWFYLRFPSYFRMTPYTSACRAETFIHACVSR